VLYVPRLQLLDRLLDQFVPAFAPHRLRAALREAQQEKCHNTRVVDDDDAFAH
jgi:hypothetical protein